uniref:RabBD domain-containing protein n=1 Tax=Buteo japonicus TaxID=224669 RepID=A0A8C0BS99_9AVES
MIDLSFLTEEEQEAIMKVLQRDAELKRAEEERVRHLPEKVKDDVQLKNMSGQWFYEAKSKRHRDKIHGADIIRASMRRKPATLGNQNKSNKAKNSWVSNVNKEVFMPPELHGIVEHPEEELKSGSRRNPFNSTASVDNLNSGESEDRPPTLPQLSKEEILSLSEEGQPQPNLENDESEKHKMPSVEPTDESQKGLVKRPVPKARKLIHKATDPASQREDFVPKPAKRTERINGIGNPPRGILKRSSSSSSTDSEVRASQMLDVQKKNGLPTATIFEGEAEKNSFTEEAEDSTQISLEKLKQVRFSSSTGKGEPLQSPQLHHHRETGQFDLLESDEIESSGNDAIRSDSSGNKQISAVKPLVTCSSASQIKTIDGLQEDTLASGQAPEQNIKASAFVLFILDLFCVFIECSLSLLTVKIDSYEKSMVGFLVTCLKWHVCVCSVHVFCLVTGSEEELNPVLMALKRSADRKMASKSLEDISSATSSEHKACVCLP